MKNGIIEENKIKDLKHILINIGVNDLDAKPGIKDFLELREIIGEIHKSIQKFESERSNTSERKQRYRGQNMRRYD